MEMPEGWKKLKNLADAFSQDPYYHKYKDPKLLDEARELMKEMAEALEYSTKNVRRDYPDVADVTESALQKLKDWK